MNQQRLLRLSLIILALAYSAAGFAAGSGGGSNDTYKPGEEGLSPEQISERAFNTGIRFRDKGLKYEAKAARAKSEKVRTKMTAKAQKAFSKAVIKQGEAVNVWPQNYQAANELGFALRKTGDYRKAIGAYNYALDINPDFHAATEYRGEAYLALGMFERTQKAYMHLFREDRSLADQLMQAIDTWVTEQSEPLSADSQAFMDWVAQRKQLAQLTADLSSNNQRSW